MQENQFHIFAMEIVQPLFDGVTFDNDDEINAALTEAQLVLRTRDEFATAHPHFDHMANILTVIVDRAPESLEGFEGQSERLFVNYTFKYGEPLKYKSSRAE